MAGDVDLSRPVGLFAYDEKPGRRCGQEDARKSPDYFREKSIDGAAVNMLEYDSLLEFLFHGGPQVLDGTG